MSVGSNTRKSSKALSIRLISTDFDGTIFTEFENPPIPGSLETLIADLQAQGANWVINTGRDMSSLMEALGRARISIQPDYLVLVEREIYRHDGVRYAPIEAWNAACARDQAELFNRVRPEVPALTAWINARFRATVYEDAFSPFCLIAGNNGDADIIHAYLEEFCARFPQLTVVRNDVYARFSHVAYNKGSALAELAKRLGLGPDEVFAAGDHLNDLPMLLLAHARWLAAPSNAVPPVMDAVRRQGGFISQLAHGAGVVDGLQHHLRQSAMQNQM